MLCSRFLKPLHGVSHGRMYTAVEAAFDWSLRWYGWTLQQALRFKPITAAISVLLLAGTVYLFEIVPKGFIPDQDNDSLNVNVQAAQGTSSYEMVDYVGAIAKVINANPYVDTFFASTGGGFGAMNSARFNLQLKPRRQRPVSAADIAQQLRPQLLRFPGFRAFVSLPPAIQIGGRMGNSSYSLTVQSIDTTILYDWAKRLETAVASLPEVQDVSDDMQMKSPRVNLVIDRDRAAALGLNASDIESALYDGFGPQWSSTIYGSAAQYKVLLELDPKYQQDADALNKIAFKAPSGALVPFESVMRLQETVGPQTINHVGELPAVSISFALRPGVSLGAAVDHIKQVAASQLPPTVTTAFQGSAKTFQQSMQNLGLLLFVAIGVVYIVLGMLYESYIHPLTILSGLPSAGLGALITLWMFGNELNIYSFVGLVMLIGIVKKNAIMQIDFALEAERRHGKTPAEAIYEGCLIRFRPIMMTTMAALLGAVPIALGFGAGGEARRPLGLAVAGGLVVSQLITLYLTPVVYTYMASIVKTRRIPDALAPNPATA